MRRSFAKLFNSSHLGVVIANPERIIDANEAFLRMIGYTREELLAGEIDWQKMTPPEFIEGAEKAMEQLRKYGVSIPYEKSYIVRDGKRVDFAVGAVRLSEDPFIWAGYTVDLSEIKKLRQAKHELLAREKVVNQLAHELNNPLAALTFLLHLAMSEGEVSAKSQRLIEEALQQVSRISMTVQQVLLETSQSQSEKEKQARADDDYRAAS